MIDLSTSQLITYTYNGTSYSIQVYKDNLKVGVYYILPQPIIQIGNTGLPSFSLTSFNNGQETTGQCNFTTVLQTPPGAVGAVQEKFPGAIIGAWEWSGGSAWFNYQYPDEQGAMQAFSTVAWPSLQPTTAIGQAAQSSGQASWSVSLPSQAAVQAFVNAFNGPNAGVFSVEYQMQVPGSLPGVDVTISFDSQTAYQFEQTIKVDKNIWGSVTKETVTINQYLKQSQAGTINIVWGAIDPDSSQGQQITNWANQTLQNQVQASVNQTMAMMSQNVPAGQDYTFSMNQVSSFSTHYVQNQVVIWVAQSATMLPGFTPAVWAEVFRTVDTRPLTVVFALENTNLSVVGISGVTLYVSSPSGNDIGTLTDASSNWIFSRPAAVTPSGAPNLSYSYYYVVQYVGGQSWQSPSVATNALTTPAVTINAGDLKALAVSFQCTNIPFGLGTGKVDYVEVDFTFVNPASDTQTDPQTVTQVLTFRDNQTVTPIQFFTYLPYTTTYQYAVKYVMGDGTAITMAPTTPDNANRVLINSPLTQQTVMLIALWSNGMSNVGVSARWVDPNNDVSAPSKTWYLPSSSAEPADWVFTAPNNPAAYPQITSQQMVINGKIVRPNTPWNNDGVFIAVSGTQTSYTVIIDPSLVDWNIWRMVSLNAYLIGTRGGLEQMQSYSFIKGSGPKFRTFLVDGIQTQLDWYYTMSYIPAPGMGQTINVPQTLCQYNTLILSSTVTTRALYTNQQLHLDPDVAAPTLAAAHKRLWPGLATLPEAEPATFA